MNLFHKGRVGNFQSGVFHGTPLQEFFDRFERGDIRAADLFDHAFFLRGGFSLGSEVIPSVEFRRLDMFDQFDISRPHLDHAGFNFLEESDLLFVIFGFWRRFGGLFATPSGRGFFTHCSLFIRARIGTRGWAGFSLGRFHHALEFFELHAVLQRNPGFVVGEMNLALIILPLVNPGR